ncbi:MAG: response regulator [Flavobacteriales bacterium]|nr:response regulator [Flavobacteriales bacterium]
MKFTEKGSVQLAVCKSQIANENPEVRHLQTAISQLQFSITDTGIGIPKEKLHTVFESFSQANASDTRRFGGTGLGLTIARNLVRLMGGDLEVESQEGRGSTFSFSLPLQTATKEAAQKNNVPLSRSSSIKFHVLVAEDNDYNFLVTRDTLKKYFLNANIIHVKNGKEAVDALQEDDYDLVLMDIQMPVMDGYEATNEIRKQNFEVQILGLTASVIRSDLDKCIAAGMNGYIAKPFRDEEFVSAVLKAIGQNGIIEVSGEVNIPKQKKLFLEMIPKRLKEMKSAMRDNRFADLKKVIHQIRPQLMKMNMQDIEPQCIETENTMDMNARVNNNVSQIILAIESKLDDLAKEKTESDH